MHGTWRIRPAVVSVITALTLVLFTCIPLRGQSNSSPQQDSLSGMWNPVEEWSGTFVDTELKKATGVFAGDLDGDGDQDVVASSWDNDLVVWYENTGESGLWPSVIVDDNLSNAIAVHLSDIDGDGDLDIVAAGHLDDIVVWYENDLPNESWQRRTIGQNLTGVSQIRAGDIDGDGDNDVAATEGGGYKVVWYENMGDGSTAWHEWLVTDTLTGPRQIRLADIDADEDMDIIVASEYKDAVVVYKQVPGTPILWTSQCVTNTLDGAKSIAIGDIDLDGDIDIAATGVLEEHFYWYEQVQGQSVNWRWHMAGACGDSAMHLEVAHLRKSGLPGIITSNAKYNCVTLWEYDPQGGWLERVVDRDLSGARALCIADVDGDIDLDIIALGQSAGDIVWYDNDLVSADDHMIPITPATTVLHQNSPNPFPGTTTISYAIPASTTITLTVHDLLGRKVRTLVNERRDAGTHTARFDAHDLPSGLYFYCLQAGDAPAQTRRMIMLR